MPFKQLFDWFTLWFHFIPRNIISSLSPFQQQSPLSYYLIPLNAPPIKCTPKSYNFIWFENPPSPNANNQTHWNHNKRNRIHEMQLIVKLFNTNIWNCFANQLVG